MIDLLWVHVRQSKGLTGNNDCRKQQQMGRPTTEILNCNIVPNPKTNLNHYSYLCLYYLTIRWPRSKRKSMMSLFLLYPLVTVHNCRCSSLTPYPFLLTGTGSFFFSTFHFHQTCIDWWRWSSSILWNRSLSLKKTAWGARGTTISIGHRPTPLLIIDVDILK